MNGAHNWRGIEIDYHATYDRGDKSVGVWPGWDVEFTATRATDEFSLEWPGRDPSEAPRIVDEHEGAIVDDILDVVTKAAPVEFDEVDADEYWRD